MEREPVTVYDTTLRDGLRNSGVAMTLEQKLRFARQLEQLNVDAVEHFPAASRMLREQPHA